MPGLGDTARAYPLEAIQEAPGGTVRAVLGGALLVIAVDGEKVRIVEAPAEAHAAQTYWFAWAAFYPETGFVPRIVALPARALRAASQSATMHLNGTLITSVSPFTQSSGCEIRGVPVGLARPVPMQTARTSDDKPSHVLVRRLSRPSAREWMTLAATTTVAISTMSHRATAEIGQYTFAGQITAIVANENNVLGNLSIDDPFNGFFELDLAVPDGLPDNPIVGSYNQDAVMAVTLPELKLGYSGFLFVTVYNDSGCCGDWFSIGADASFGDWSVSNFGVSLRDSTASAFESDALPSVLELSDFDEPVFRLIGFRISTSDSFQVYGVISSLILVPAPSAGIMALTLLAGACLRTRRHRRPDHRCA